MAAPGRSSRWRSPDAEPDWARLERLRAGFLAPSGRGLQDYWQSAEDLDAYDQVFAPRIGWKWAAVLAELRERGVRLDPASVLDFGCGTGVATRTVLPFLDGPPPEVALHDRSPRAMAFARERCREEFPQVTFETLARIDCRAKPDLLLLSHVLTELEDSQAAPLLDLVRRARTVLWVEPGTREASRRLARWTDPLRKDFEVLAPCTHRNACRALAGGDQDWCHFFAAPPATVFTDPRWVMIGKRLKIDLRALPYCFMALRGKDAGAAPAPSAQRLIGRPDVRAKFARFYVCDAHALAVREVFKGPDAELYRRLKKGGAAVRWPD